MYEGSKGLQRGSHVTGMELTVCGYGAYGISHAQLKRQSEALTTSEPPSTFTNPAIPHAHTPHEP